MNKKESFGVQQGQHDELIIYQMENGTIKIDVRLHKETVWLTQQQIAHVFDKERTVITKHIKRILADKELDESVCAIFAHTATDGKVYNTKYYNLDMIISVGYRVNSKRGIQFRRWATAILREYLIKGYSINQEKVIQDRVVQLRETVELLTSTIIDQSLTNDVGKELLNLINAYTKTWQVLVGYDEFSLTIPNNLHTASELILSYDEALQAISTFKQSLKINAGSLFGFERAEGLKAILGNLEQTFGMQQLYSSIEEKAAHLLYFVIKDHPFGDGNKRIGSLLFLIYISRAKITLKLVDASGMTALALLIAQSHPEQKELIIKLIINLISK